MGGQDAIRLGSTAGGATLGALLAPLTMGLSIPIGAAAGGALGAGAATAGTGGKLRDSLLNAGLGGLGGGALGALGGPALSSLMTLPGASTPGVGALAGPLAAPVAGSGMLPAGTGISTASVAQGLPASLAKTGTTLPISGTAVYDLSKLGALASGVTPKDPLTALMMAGMLSSMTNPHPIPYQGVQASSTPGRGLPAGNFDPAQYMIRRERRG